MTDESDLPTDLSKHGLPTPDPDVPKSHDVESSETDALESIGSRASQQTPTQQPPEPHVAPSSVAPQEPLPPYPMGLQFRDFVPQQLSNFGLFKVAEYETFEAAVWAANRWLMEAPIELIQLETVVLPNIWSKYEEGTTDGSLGTSSAATSHWHQFLRVWYRPYPTESVEGE